jgi:hypothetical protein
MKLISCSTALLGKLLVESDKRKNSCLSATESLTQHVHNSLPIVSFLIKKNHAFMKHKV